jgi:hypothetical protein
MGQQSVTMGADIVGGSTSLQAQSYVDGWEGIWRAMIVGSRERLDCGRPRLDSSKAVPNAALRKTLTGSGHRQAVDCKTWCDIAEWCW